MPKTSLSRKKTGKQGEKADTASNFTLLIDPLAIQSALQQISKSLNDPEYREQLTKITQLSVTHSLETLQRLSRLSTRTARLNEKEMSKVIDSSIDDLMRAYLQFSSDLIVLLQKLSSRTIEILEKAPER